MTEQTRLAFSVGLTGGIGCGKTTVADMFAALGASVIDTDVIAHSLTAPHGAAMPALLAEFGDEFATPDGAPGGDGPQLTIPPELAEEVEISPYDEDGYIGSTVRFSGLTFDQVSRLSAIGGVAGGRAELQMRRVGGRIAVQGRADLTTVAVDRSDFQLKISFPGEVAETNGEAEGGTVSWQFTPGEVGQISASVASADPNAPSTLGWTLFLGLLVAVAGGAAVLLARRNRNPPVHS